MKSQASKSALWNLDEFELRTVDLPGAQPAPVGSDWLMNGHDCLDTAALQLEHAHQSVADRKEQLRRHRFNVRGDASQLGDVELGVAQVRA